MKPLTAAVALVAAALAGAARPAAAQTTPKIRIGLEARSEGQSTRDAAGSRLYDEVRRGLESISDLQLIPLNEAMRVVSIITGTTAGSTSASVIVTEKYDRETLMVLGVEEDELASRMMALQIVNDHQIFTGADAADIARRIVASLNDGIFARLRALRPKP